MKWGKPNKIFDENQRESSKFSLLDSCEILNAANYANILILYHSNEFSLINEFLTYLYICVCM